jgi:hypothetical protein
MADSNGETIIAISLDGKVGFQLNREALSGVINMEVRMRDDANPVTLVLDGYRDSGFDIAIALRRSLLELFDVETDNLVSIPSSDSDDDAGSIVVPAESQIRSYKSKFDVFSTFWNEFLQPGHKYEIRWSKNAGQSWCYYNQPEDPLKNATRLPVQRYSVPLKLTVFDDDSVPPLFSMSLTPSANICHLSSHPRFAFRLVITSHAREPITVNFDKTPFRELRGLDDVVTVVDVDTNEEVEFPWGIGCWENDVNFPTDFEFEEFIPGVPYKRMFYLNPFDSKASNGGELESLKEGLIYKADLNKNLPGSFGTWMKGRKVELLKGSAEEKKKRWSRRGDEILFEKSDSFTFETGA